MSDRASGHTSRSFIGGRLALVLGLLAIAAGPAVPVVTAASGLTLTTPYPAIVAEPGTTASFKLSIDVATASYSSASSRWRSSSKGCSSTVG